MRQNVHLNARKALALTVAVAALAAPTAAYGYPIIGDEPGPAAQKAGHEWMAKRALKMKQSKKHLSKHFRH
jgi:hypothetical protein